jgi:histidinol-phosphate/aromatic aminotransferase/cobyric acid decarboxylase-like protein
MPRTLIVELAERVRRLAPPPPGELAALAERSARGRRELLRLDAEDLRLAPPPLASLGTGGEGDAARWLAARLDVSVESLGEVLLLRGPVPPHHLLALAFVNPGDAVLVPDPAPPLFRSAALLADATPRPWPRDGGARLHFLAPCAPPTGQPDPPADIDAAVGAGLAQSRIVAADLSALLLDLGAPGGGLVAGEPPPAIPHLFHHPRAADAGVGIVGFDALFGAGNAPFAFLFGNRDLVLGVRRLAEGMGIPHGAPAARALAPTLAALDRALAAARADLRARRDALVDGLQRLGFRATSPTAGLAIWVAAPRGYRGLPFARMLLRRAGILVRPGVDFGETGEHFVAFSLAAPPDVLFRALGRIEELAPRKLRLRRQLARARRRRPPAPPPA